MKILQHHDEDFNIIFKFREFLNCIINGKESQQKQRLLLLCFIFTLRTHDIIPRKKNEKYCQYKERKQLRINVCHNVSSGRDALSSGNNKSSYFSTRTLYKYICISCTFSHIFQLTYFHYFQFFAHTLFLWTPFLSLSLFYLASTVL